MVPRDWTDSANGVFERFPYDPSDGKEDILNCDLTFPPLSPTGCPYLQTNMHKSTKMLNGIL